MMNNKEKLKKLYLELIRKNNSVRMKYKKKLLTKSFLTHIFFYIHFEFNQI